MKLQMVVLLSILLLSGCKTFDKYDKGMILAMYMVSAVDYYQTEQILDDPNLAESNRSINSNEDAALVIFGSATAIVAVAYFLPNEWRKHMLGLYTGYNTKVVIDNQKLLTAYE